MKFFLPLLFPLMITGLLRADPVKVPAQIDHSVFDELLRTYVNDQGLVDYKAWFNSEADMERLDEYLQLYRWIPEAVEAEGDDQIASLLNAYNAFTIDFILDNYPVKSIRLLNDPFDGKRYRIGERAVSADEIEHDTLRPLIGWKVHALVVCAARSCPPLPNFAFTPGGWEESIKNRYRTWLGREDLNEILPANDRVKISKIFDWYEEDYTGDHSIKNVLLRFGPEPHRAFLKKKDYKIDYKKYHWGLNAQSDLGKDYTHSVFRSLF